MKLYGKQKLQAEREALLNDMSSLKLRLTDPAYYKLTDDQLDTYRQLYELREKQLQEVEEKLKW